ncbi:MAG TPA: phospho-N-acetylmuramoyl-pentapeptide-transferase, partial [Rhodospirillales bacterium]|nr:phospho-N-acetylmuramoyl-pentapeptide-transferase [Rhodospirillales bacterium]
MLFNFSAQFVDQFTALNVFRYITFRTGGAMLTALIVSFVCGPYIIRLLKSYQTEGQPIREDGPEGHILTKAGTPTMGGFMILLALVLATLLWADLRNGYIWAALVVTVAFGLIGFFDDYAKVSLNNSKGISSKLKLLLQMIFALAATIWITSLTSSPLATSLALPFFKSVLIDLGWFFVVFGILVIVGASNAVNLTDGLDGLAIGPVMIAASVFAIISYL